MYYVAVLTKSIFADEDKTYMTAHMSTYTEMEMEKSFTACQTLSTTHYIRITKVVRST